LAGQPITGSNSPTAAFLEKQHRTALFQTRSRHVEEPAQLTLESGSGSALQLRRDFLRLLFCRIPPSRLSGKTGCSCVLASSSSLFMKYDI